MSGVGTDAGLQPLLANERWRRAKRMRLLYLFLLFPVAALFIFNYLPIYGVLIAFKDFKIIKGAWGSPWNDFEHFRLAFESPLFGRILRNTVIISALRILFGFPAPIVLALLINEVGSQPYKRAVQSVSYLPHFMSWVILAGILFEILSPQRGVVAAAYGLFGQEAPNLFGTARFFRPLLVATDIWKEIGWGTIIYLAAISAINPELHESALIDGANRLQRAVHITVPSIVAVVTIMFILRLGSIMDAGFDQVFNLYNPGVYEVADIIDTYVYRVGLVDLRFDFATAIGLFKNVVGVVLIVGANLIIRRYSDYAIW